MSGLIGCRPAAASTDMLTVAPAELAPASTATIAASTPADRIRTPQPWHRPGRLSSAAGRFDLRRRQELLQSAAAGLLVQEALVAGVLEQPPDQVRHPGHQVSDRTVRPHPEPLLGQGILKIVAQTPQH